MLTLITYPSAFGLFSASPFCVKTALMLQQAGQHWQRSDLLDPRKMPHQKLPVLRTPERLVPDSDLIRDWLESQGADFDKGLTDLQKAQSRALIRMAEEHLYFQIVLDRWGNDTVWPILRDTFFTGIPALIPQADQQFDPEIGFERAGVTRRVPVFRRRKEGPDRARPRGDLGLSVARPVPDGRAPDRCRHERWTHSGGNAGNPGGYSTDAQDQTG